MYMYMYMYIYIYIYIIITCAPLQGWLGLWQTSQHWVFIERKPYKNKHKLFLADRK